MIPMTEDESWDAILELRQASDRDLPDVVDLLNRAYRGKGGECGWTTEADLISGDRISMPTLRAEIESKPRANLLIWRPGAKVCGCVWLEPAGEDQWYLGSLAIEPQLQKCHRGRGLLAAAEEWAWERGARLIKMTVIHARETLIGWYERRGYVRTGETEPFPYSDTRFGVPNRPGLVFEVLKKRLR